MRDADLYDDVAKFVTRKAGRLAELVLRIAELMAGPDLGSIAHDTTKEFKPPTKDEQAQVKRELTENW